MSALIENLKLASDASREAWNEFNRHPLWDAIRKHIASPGRSGLVTYPEGFSGFASQYDVNFHKISRAANGAWIEGTYSYYNEDAEQTYNHSFSIGVPDDLLLNFTQEKFEVFAAKRRKEVVDNAIERVQKILKQAGVTDALKKKYER